MELGKDVVTGIESEELIAPEVAPTLVPDVGAIIMVDVIMKKRHSRAEEVHEGGELIRTAKGGTSSAVGGDRTVPGGTIVLVRTSTLKKCGPSWRGTLAWR